MAVPGLNQFKAEDKCLAQVHNAVWVYHVSVIMRALFHKQMKLFVNMFKHMYIRSV